MSNGFSLVEVVIALMVFTVGVLGMGATIGYVSRQVEAADLRTERSTVVRRAVEQLHALPFAGVNDRTYTDAKTMDGYKVWWDVEHNETHMKNVDLYSEGPGFSAGTGREPAVRDTVATTIADKELGS